LTYLIEAEGIKNLKNFLKILDFVDENLNIILGMILAIILRFDIQDISVESNRKRIN
jgi:hypothetical protein